MLCYIAIVPPTQFIHSKSHEVNLLCPSGNSSFVVTFGTTSYTYTPQKQALPVKNKSPQTLPVKTSSYYYMITCTFGIFCLLGGNS